MGKKSNRKTKVIPEERIDKNQEFSPQVEEKFKMILRIMSWVVGICFTLIIILPNFDFYLVDAIVKFVFYLGVLNLILFAIFEMFGNAIKNYLAKYFS